MIGNWFALVVTLIVADLFRKRMVNWRASSYPQEFWVMWTVATYSMGLFWVMVLVSELLEWWP